MGEESDFKENIRAITRPILLVLLFGAACYFQLRGMSSDFISTVQYTAVAAMGEWILERPLLKIAGKA
jgi:hypothetical protein